MCPDQSTQAVSRTCLRSLLAGLACTLVFAVSPAQAQSSNVELAAVLGGRIIGAAKACGLNAERIRRTSERLNSVMGLNASSPAERDSARTQFAASQAAGAEEVRGERSRCQNVHVEFSEMEVKLGRAPASDGDHVAAKRGVPAMGALKSDPAATRKQ